MVHVGSNVAHQLSAPEELNVEMECNQPDLCARPNNPCPADAGVCVSEWGAARCTCHSGAS